MCLKLKLLYKCKLSGTESVLFRLFQILRRCGDSVELVDVSAELPQLIRRPGLKSWKVCLHFSF